MKKTKVLILNNQLFPKAFWLFAAFVFIPLLAFYVLQINSFAKETYSLQNYQKQLAETSQQNGVLEINFSKNNSLANIDNFLQGKNFEKTNQTRFIQLLGGTAAVIK